MSEPIDVFLSCLEGVKSTGQSKWAARCPAHGDKTPSLAVKAGADGTVLLHCFAGCTAHEIVSAVGLELSDLFPKSESGKPQRKPWNAADILRAVKHELFIIATMAEAMRKAPLSADDDQRLGQAISRVISAAQVAL